MLPHRHGQDELQNCQSQSRCVDEATSREHEVGEGSFAGIAHNEPLMTPLIVAADSSKTQSTDPSTLQVTASWKRGWKEAYVIAADGFLMAWTVGGSPEDVGARSVVVAKPACEHAV